MREINCKREMIWMGEDLIICIQNEHGHVGCVVTAQPYIKLGVMHATLNVWNRLSHKDDFVAKMYAKTASMSLNRVCVCACGIHLDDISEFEMCKIMDWVNMDIECMVKELQQAQY